MRFTSTYTGLLLMVFARGPCDNELPPYQDPTDVFEARMSALYVYTLTDNSLKIFLTAENIFDETFEGQAVFQGKVTITMERDPSIHKTFSVSAANLAFARNYNSAGSLRIDPQDSVQFMVSWNFVDDNGVDLRQGVFRYSPDLSCTSLLNRQIAAPEIFNLQGTMKVYTKVATATSKLAKFRMCHVNVYIPPPTDCPPILGCPE